MMRELVEYIAKALVEQPDEVQVIGRVVWKSGRL